MKTVVKVLKMDARTCNRFHKANCPRPFSKNGLEAAKALIVFYPVVLSPIKFATFLLSVAVRRSKFLGRRKIGRMTKKKTAPKPRVARVAHQEIFTATKR